MTKQSIIFTRLALIALVISFCKPVHAQESGTTLAANDGALRSKILRSSSSDTVLRHVEMERVGYDRTKNNLPYYLASQNTSYGQYAKGTLQIKKYVVVGEPHASVLRKYYSQFLTNRFEVTEIPSITRGTNQNVHRIYPFRVNSQNQIEELVDYNITWQVLTNNSNGNAKGKPSFKTTSILASGIWYKLAIVQDGIYKIDKTFLNDMGIKTIGLDPKNIRIYGNGGKMVPERNNDARLDDLEESAIKVVGEDDGSFDNGDYILFYASGTTEWRKTGFLSGLKFRHTKSLYSDSSYYYLNIDLGKGKRVTAGANIGAGANTSSNSYDYYNYHEANVINFGKSGREFYGEYFDITNTYNFIWDEGDFVVGDSVSAEATVAAANRASTEFAISGNGVNFNVITDGITGVNYSPYASARTGAGRALNNTRDLIGFSITKNTPKSIGWLDKLTVNARRELNVRAKQFTFRDTRTVGAGKMCEFSITVPANTPLNLWNITDPLNAIDQPFSTSGTLIRFTTSTSTLQEFCIAPSTDYLRPSFSGLVPNQNLHSLTSGQYIIVTHPLFIKEAQRLASFHEKQEGLTYVIATTEQIYNEFSSGTADPGAIRDFIRMLYFRNFGTDNAVKYVLLLGDGSYNNMSKNLVNNSSLIPTYQSNETLSSTTSIVTDDFFALMDSTEGYNAENFGKIDLGVGRFPCRTVDEVRGILSKIENYYARDLNFQSNLNNTENCNSISESTMSDWRNWLVFLGDDEDGALHMRQSNDLTKVIQNLDPSFNIDKIFLDAYQRFSTPGGPRYPDASADFLKRIKKGALIFNYTGHGGEVGLTAERMIDVDIINGLDNFNKLPLFITATCEFSRFDDPSRTSAGELCLLNPKGGAIALFTTARLAFAEPNYNLNKVTLEKLFERTPDGIYPTLGEAIYRTKADKDLSTDYITNFHLLGDPAVRLMYPQDRVMTSMINNSAVDTTKQDTLAALQKVTISGYVADYAGNKKTDFNGVVYPSVFDKERIVDALMNTTSSAANTQEVLNNDTIPYKPFRFNLQKNILYRGKALVTNGDFSFTFMVPKDISFALGPGKISYYATNGDKDANGFYTQLLVGGASKNIVVDNTGPQVSLFMNEKNFVSGGLTNEKPIFFADLIDSSGINTLGTGLGHDVTVIMDNNTAKPIILNDYYEANLNSYQSGRIRYPFSQLSQGEHRLTFKVWDIQNNSNVVDIDFVVAESAELAIKHVLNYPNPFTTKTKFLFEHNQPCNPLKVTVQIYTVSGKLVKTIQTPVMCDGFRPEGIDWDGKDDFGDKLARGVYVYRLGILDVENKKAEKIEKLVILN